MADNEYRGFGFCAEGERPTPYGGAPYAERVLATSLNGLETSWRKALLRRKLLVRVARGRLMEACHWCDANVPGGGVFANASRARKWTVAVNRRGGKWAFYFEQEADAIHFKLAFSD